MTFDFVDHGNMLSKLHRDSSPLATASRWNLSKFVVIKHFACPSNIVMTGRFEKLHVHLKQCKCSRAPWLPAEPIRTQNELYRRNFARGATFFVRLIKKLNCFQLCCCTILAENVASREKLNRL